MSALPSKVDIEAEQDAEIGGRYPKFLERKCNNSNYRCDPQTEGISLPRSSLFEKARSNLFLASSRPFLWSQGFPRLIQHGLQKVECLQGQRIHLRNL